MILNLDEFFEYVCDQIKDFGSHNFTPSVESVGQSMAVIKLNFSALDQGYRPLPIEVYVRYLYEPKMTSRMKHLLEPPVSVFHIEQVTMLDVKSRSVKINYSKQAYAPDFMSNDELKDLGSIGAVLAAGIYHDAEEHIKTHEHAPSPTKKIDKTFLTKFYALVATEVKNNTFRLFSKVQKVEDDHSVIILRDMDADDEPNYDTTPFTITVYHSYNDKPNPYVENPNLISIPQVSFKNSDGYGYTQSNLNLTLGQVEATNATAMHRFAKAVAILIADGIKRLK